MTSAPSEPEVPTPYAVAAPHVAIDGNGSCHPSYEPCLPVVDDLNCSAVRELGRAPVRVVGPAAYRLDGDGDGTVCQ